MKRNRDGNRRIREPLLHHDMAAALTNLSETVLREETTKVFSRKKTRSLPNRDLEAGDEYLRVQAGLDFVCVRRLEEEFNCFAQVCLSFFDRVALARDVDFRAKCDIAVAFALDYGRKVACGFHERIDPGPEWCPV